MAPEMVDRDRVARIFAEEAVAAYVRIRGEDGASVPKETVARLHRQEEARAKRFWDDDLGLREQLQGMSEDEIRADFRKSCDAAIRCELADLRPS